MDEIKLNCLENNGYETPELNDKLYLHFRGFKKIENLNLYVGCKSIWLDSNGFEKIENLSALVELRCLYLAKNLITKIEGLEKLINLTILDLSNNRISIIENLSCCPSLQTVNLSHNSLSSIESIAHFKECVSITNIDLTNNRLSADEGFFELISSFPSVVTLSLNGNDITRLPSFRKKLIASMPKLGYLDRPIDEQEKLFATAYIAGGAEAEADARQQWKDQQALKRVNEMNEFKAWQAEQQKIREKAKEEGRSLIREMTAEEIQTRREEAEAAAAAEREMINLGIDKLGARYWRIENSSGGDPLDIATQQLLKEKELAKLKLESKDNENLPVISEDDVVIEIESSSQPEETSILPEISEVVPTSVVNSPLRESIDSILDKSGEDSISEVEPTKCTVDNEEVAQQLRDMRVSESFAIYKRQLEQKKLSGEISLVSSSVSSTWETGSNLIPSSGPVPSNMQTNTTNESSNDVVIEVKPRPMYWSEVMDVELGKLVKKCLFDFDEISGRMIELAESGKLPGNDNISKNPSLLTSEECRLRWSQLDAAVWAENPPDISALDTVFKICINPSVLGAAHGAQPSFQALASLAASSKPNYLTVPTSFPSVQDINDEDAGSDLDLD